MPSTDASLNHLPTELLLLVLSYLPDIRPLHSLTLTSRRLHLVTQPLLTDTHTLAFTPLYHHTTYYPAVSGYLPGSFILESDGVPLIDGYPALLFALEWASSSPLLASAIFEVNLVTGHKFEVYPPGDDGTSIIGVATRLLTTQVLPNLTRLTLSLNHLHPSRSIGATMFLLALLRDPSIAPHLRELRHDARECSLELLLALLVARPGIRMFDIRRIAESAAQSHADNFWPVGWDGAVTRRWENVGLTIPGMAGAGGMEWLLDLVKMGELGGLKRLRIETSTTPEAATHEMRVGEAGFVAALVPMLREGQAGSLRNLTLDFHIPPPTQMAAPPLDLKDFTALTVLIVPVYLLAGAAPDFRLKGMMSRLPLTLTTLRLLSNGHSSGGGDGDPVRVRTVAAMEARRVVVEVLEAKRDGRGVGKLSSVGFAWGLLVDIERAGREEFDGVKRLGREVGVAIVRLAKR